MSFLEHMQRFKEIQTGQFLSRVTQRDVEKVLLKDHLNHFDLLTLLSPMAEPLIESMAQKASAVTRQYFGKTVGLFAPIYISDYCSNQCVYCGFSSKNNIPRKKLTLDEIENEAKALASTGIRHTMILTGEDPQKTPLSYLEAAVKIIKKHFASISLEIFPMDAEEYEVLNQAGADSLTVYQEVYDKEIYKIVHPRGKKADYNHRLMTPERGARAGFRSINIGPLFGLGDLITEAFWAGIHAKYLEDKFPHVEIGLSLPRMRKATGGIKPMDTLSDIKFVQFMLAWRLFMPRVGLSISTRESPQFRDRLIHLGATRLSAGSRADVGGYSINKNRNTAQFQISDERSVAEVAAMIREQGFQPVFKDWH